MSYCELQVRNWQEKLESLQRFPFGVRRGGNEALISPHLVQPSWLGAHIPLLAMKVCPASPNPEQQVLSAKAVVTERHPVLATTWVGMLVLVKGTAASFLHTPCHSVTSEPSAQLLSHSSFRLQLPGAGVPVGYTSVFLFAGRCGHRDPFGLWWVHTPLWLVSVSLSSRLTLVLWPWFPQRCVWTTGVWGACGHIFLNVLLEFAFWKKIACGNMKDPE